MRDSNGDTGTEAASTRTQSETSVHAGSPPEWTVVDSATCKNLRVVLKKLRFDRESLSRYLAREASASNQLLVGHVTNRKLGWNGANNRKRKRIRGGEDSDTDSDYGGERKKIKREPHGKNNNLRLSCDSCKESSQDDPGRSCSHPNYLTQSPGAAPQLTQSPESAPLLFNSSNTSPSSFPSSSSSPPSLSSIAAKVPQRDTPACNGHLNGTVLSATGGQLSPIDPDPSRVKSEILGSGSGGSTTGSQRPTVVVEEEYWDDSSDSDDEFVVTVEKANSSPSSSSSSSSSLATSQCPSSSSRTLSSLAHVTPPYLTNGCDHAGDHPDEDDEHQMVTRTKVEPSTSLDINDDSSECLPLSWRLRQLRGGSILEEKHAVDGMSSLSPDVRVDNNDNVPGVERPSGRLKVTKQLLSARVVKRESSSHPAARRRGKLSLTGDGESQQVKLSPAAVPTTNGRRQSDSVPERRFSERRFQGEKPFLCNHCPLSFSSQENKVIHERTHREKPFECAFCEMRFTFELSLKRHIKIH